MSRWLCALLVAACGSRPLPCERIASHARSLVEVLGPLVDDAPSPRDRMYEMILARCTKDGWPEAARACVLATRWLAQLPSCRTTLTDAQAAALQTDVASLRRDELAHAHEIQEAVTAEAKRRRAPEVTPSAPTLVLFVPVQGDIVVDGTAVPDHDIDDRFRAAVARDRNTTVVLQAETGVPHGRVVDLMERARTSGLTRFAIGTAPAH